MMRYIRVFSNSYLVAYGAGCVIARLFAGVDGVSGWMPTINILSLGYGLLWMVLSVLINERSRSGW